MSTAAVSAAALRTTRHRQHPCGSPGRSSSDQSEEADEDELLADQERPLIPKQHHTRCRAQSGLQAVDVQKPRRKHAQQHNTSRPQWYIIHPNGRKYSYWWGFTIAAAAFTGVFEPFVVGFVSDPGELPLDSLASLTDNVLQLIFLVDMTISFFVAFHENEILVTRGRAIAWRYVRGRFWLDLLAWVPFDLIATLIICPCRDVRTVQYISLARLAHLARLYRLRWWFSHLEYNLTVNLLFTTLMRNLVYVFYSTHAAACGFYFIALQYGLGENTWIGKRFDNVEAIPIPVRYVFSIYWSITTLATVGYGDLSACNTGEAIWSSIFMFVNLALSAYILGTITLLVVKSDEKAGEYREQSNSMKQYGALNDLPQNLRKSMQAHLRLHFANQAASDEAVLHILPTPLRRRVLRHLYQEQLRANALFKHARQRFLDALLSVARLELFMPKVEIMSSGDFVNELFLVVAGEAQLMGPHEAEAGEDRALSHDMSSVHGGIRTELGPGDVFGEVAFFTEVAQMEAVRTVSTCRILVVTRDRFDSVAAAFPLSSRAVLTSLQQHCERRAQKEFRGHGGRQAFERALQSERPHLRYGWSSPELAEDDHNSHRSPSQTGSRSRFPSEQQAQEVMDRVENGSGSGHGRDELPQALSTQLSPRQEQMVGQLIRVRDLVQQQVVRQDSERTNQFLYAASYGDGSKIRQMLQQGFDVDAHDYDGRTALMLACAKGHMHIVEALQAAGADTKRRDNLGGHALLEACKAGHEHIIDKLKERSIWDTGQQTEVAALLCECVFNGDLQLLRRLLQAGVTASAADYDARTPLHIAAAEGLTAAAGILIEAGGRDLVLARDRWDRTPLDEAKRVKSQPLVNMLEEALQEDASHEGARAGHKWW